MAGPDFRPGAQVKMNQSFLSLIPIYSQLVENQGICPPTKWLSSCSPPVAHDCVVDVDCGLKDKCCYNGCYMTCKAPNEGKLGQKQRRKTFTFYKL